MRNDIDELVLKLTEIASQKQPGQRADQSFLAFSSDIRDRAGFVPPRPNASAAARKRSQDERLHLMADCQPCTLSA